MQLDEAERAVGVGGGAESVDGLDRYAAEFEGRVVEFVRSIGVLEGEVLLESCEPVLHSLACMQAGSAHVA